jgi:hypothetical protein
MSPSKEGGGLSLLGFGAAACVACCIGPVLALLGGLSVAGLVSAVSIGGGVLVAAVAGVGYLVVRRRQAGTSCAVPAEAVMVAAPKLRVSVEPVRAAPGGLDDTTNGELGSPT